MRSVVVVGIGQTPVRENWDKSIREIAGEAIIAALVDGKRESVDGLFVGNMLSGMLSRQENLGALVTDWVGLHGTEAFKVEAACGSGAAALRMAIMAVASGELSSAIALGVEKMTDTIGVETNAALATAADADFESIHGLSFVAINALVMQRYMYQFGWRHNDFAQFSINSHTNAMHNPNARLHSIISELDYQRSRMVANPINLLDASPIGDGAAAVLIVPQKDLDDNRRNISIIGSAAAIDTLAVHDRKDPIRLHAASKSARKAYQQAGISIKDIDLFELHDAFSIMAALSLEACGFAETGQGPRLALDGEITPDGKIPVSTLGGLKARGHPVGATGIYQIIEVVQQLRGEAGPSQIDNAQIGMAQNIGGSGATVITHILRSIH